ncbi:MAG: rhomboid family intramembrane serine protease [Chitinophagaceae bacterium]|nr:rhomboid family intramembrane serine protease [Chitinophagaceae bacterium]
MTQYRGINGIPPVVKNLLAINIVIWIAQIYFRKQGIALEVWGALWGIDTGNFKVWQLVTHMFMHASVDEFGRIEFMHIFFNMLTLWMFGRILENFWGSKNFLQFYIICGLAAPKKPLSGPRSKKKQTPPPKFFFFFFRFFVGIA